MKKFMTSLPARLLLAIIIGIVLGLVIPGEGWGLSVMQVAVTLKYIMSQLINFCVPLIIIGFIAPSITKLGLSLIHIFRHNFHFHLHRLPVLPL